MKRFVGIFTFNAQKLSLLFFVTLIIIQLLIVMLRPGFELSFGAEYGRIAKSMLAGNGYSNTFGGEIETGPTAWMLPFLVFVLSAFFYLGLSDIPVFILLTFMKFIAYSFTFYFILRVIEYNKLKVNYLLYYSIFIFYLLFSPSQNFEKISDLWITVFFTSLFLYAYFNFYGREKPKGFWLLIFVFAFSPLVNPSYTLGFVSVVFCAFLNQFVKGLDPMTDNKTSTISRFFKNLLSVSFYKHLVFALVLFLSIGLWSYRNYIVFDKFIPSKSNMWFEFHLTNIIDTDGQLSFSTSYRGHPNARKDLREEVKKLGEIEWVEKYHKSSLEYLESNFDDYLDNVSFRLYNAFIFMENDMDVVQIVDVGEFSTVDKTNLSDNKLISGNEWICLFYSEGQIKEIFNRIGIIEKELIFSDWENARQVYYNKKYSPSNLVRSIFMSLIPLICIIALFFIPKIRKKPLYIILVTLYFVYLTPYILISHQIRYQRPLFLIQVVLVYLFIITIVEIIKAKYVFEQKVK